MRSAGLPFIQPPHFTAPEDWWFGSNPRSSEWRLLPICATIKNDQKGKSKAVGRRNDDCSRPLGRGRRSAGRGVLAAEAARLNSKTALWSGGTAILSAWIAMEAIPEFKLRPNQPVRLESPSLDECDDEFSDHLRGGNAPREPGPLVSASSSR